MSGSGFIDLSALPAPEVIETISYEAILARKKSRFIEKFPEYTADLESDPVMKLLELEALDEMTLRQDMNDKAKSLMLAFAKGADLEHLGANVAVKRVMLDAGDPTANPPIEPTYESDDALKRRTQLAPEAINTAGSEGAYTFHALSAGDKPTNMVVESPNDTTVVVTYTFDASSFSAKVKDAKPVKTNPGEVTVYILSHEGDGTPTQETLDAVTAHLSTKSVRPLTDNVIVSAATIKPWDVKATLELYDGPDAGTVFAQAVANGEKYKIDKLKLGENITRSGLYAAFHVPGVRNVLLYKGNGNVWADTLCNVNEAPYCTGMVIE